jgi:HSP20 family protein
MSTLRKAVQDLPDPVFADVMESDEAYLLVVDVPGATAATVDASIEGSRLRIEARRRKDVPPEFAFAAEERSLFLDIELPLPAEVTSTDARGTVERGVLELRLPKAGATPGESIRIE